MKIIILAGGSGTRLWPMSRAAKSKQFNAVIGEKTLLETTLDRFAGSYAPHKIFISTTPQCLANVRQILPSFSKENIIIEPEGRDTAAAMGYVSGFMSLLDPDEPMVFIPSDHYIKDTAKFLEVLQVAEEKIKDTGKLVDVGIVPESPSTALGYTKIGKMLSNKNGIEIYEFLGHKEKPVYEKAKKYLESGNYLWHGNFYMWTPKLFLEAFKKYSPEVYNPLHKVIKFLQEKKSEKEIALQYSKIPRVMIDYAVTEKMNPRDIFIIKGDFGWSDIGDWDVLHKKAVLEKDKEGNLFQGDWVGLDTSQSLIYSYPEKIVATIGVDDMIIVDTPDALLVCPKGRSQDVKKIVEKMKKDRKRKKYL
jgi:mannose-1-phosphate guanylyltransferase